MFSLIFRVTALLGYASAMLYFMHMFQLNSYHADVQIKWLKTNFAAFCAKITPAPISLITSFFGNIGLIIGSVFNIVFLIVNLPAKAKKPLVFTARVKRMIVSFTLITAIFLFPASRFLGIYVYSLFLFLPCFIIILANFINTPIEKAVGNHYIKEACDRINSLPRLTVIGITGSYGKTSTKFYLKEILSAKYNVLMTPESYNTTMGVVKTVRESLMPTHDIFICEMGAKNVGEIKEICDIVKPDFGIITSIGPAHLESFKTIENITKTKFELCDALPEENTVFLNGDNEYIASHTPSRNAVYYGAENTKASVKAENIKVSEHGTSFDVICADGRYLFETKLLGKHNVINILGCISVALHLGVSLPEMALPIRRLKSAPHRLELRGGGETVIIDDAFNSNPSGSRAALDVLSEFPGVRIMITPGMVELGDKEAEYNRDFGKYACDKCDYVFLVGTRITKSIKDGLLSCGFPEERCITFGKVTEAINYAYGIEEGKKKYVLLENDLPDNY